MPADEEAAPEKAVMAQELWTSFSPSEKERLRAWLGDSASPIVAPVAIADQSIPNRQKLKAILTDRAMQRHPGMASCYAEFCICDACQEDRGKQYSGGS